MTHYRPTHDLTANRAELVRLLRSNTYQCRRGGGYGPYSANGTPHYDPALPMTACCAVYAWAAHTGLINLHALPVGGPWMLPDVYEHFRRTIGLSSGHIYTDNDDLLDFHRIATNIEEGKYPTSAPIDHPNPNSQEDSQP